MAPPDDRHWTLKASGGVLLVDEIDTGLHHKTLVDLWRLVVRAAKRLHVQVFATTHSGDCWKALARYLESSPEDSDQVSLQRLEADREKAVAFPGSRLRIAYENDIEVR